MKTRHKQKNKDSDLSFKISVVITALVFVLITIMSVYFANSSEIFQFKRNPSALIDETKSPTGNAIAILSFGIEKSQGYAMDELLLLEGWNFISLYLDQADYSINETFSAIEGKYQFVMRWNASSQNFDVYSSVSQQNPFNIISNRSSYFIYMLEDEVLSLEGAQFSDMNISLGNQWNTPSYPYVFEANVTEYLDKLGENYSFMMKWDAQEDLFDVYSRLGSENPFETIRKGEGQFIYITSTSENIEYVEEELI